MDFYKGFIRRLNDTEYLIALANYVDELCEKRSKEIEKECNKNPFLKNRMKKLKEKLNGLSNDELADAITFAIGNKAKDFTNEIMAFNEKWDKEHYKVIYGKFGENKNE